MLFFELVLRGCPRKIVFLHWFYKVVREQWWFYIGFTSLSATHADFTLVLLGCPRTTGAGTPSTLSAGAGGGTLSPNSPSTRIETPLARPRSFASPRPLARANETKRFPSWTHPPNLQYRALQKTS